MAAKDRLGTAAVGTGSIPVSRIMAGFVFLICIALIGIEAVKLFNERGKVLADARKDTANLASSLAQHADLTFKSADTLLVSIVQRLDRDGVMVIASVGDTNSSNFSGDDYFVHHRDRDSHELFVGKPASGGTAEGWHIPIARRFNRADGSFAGVAVIALDPGYFQTL